MYRTFLTNSSLGLFSFLLFGSLVKLTILGWLRRSRREKFECVGRVHSLYSYPVKSCGGVEIKEADAGVLGLEYKGTLDRHWMVTRNSEPLKGRPTHRMKLVSVTPLGGGDIKLEAPGMNSLSLYTDTFSEISTCRVYTVVMDVLDCGDEAARWFSDFLRVTGLRLVFSPSHLSKREAITAPVAWDNNTKHGDLTGFNFLTSYMVASTSSLHDLNQRIDSPVSMSNFRPNIVIEGTPAYDEDTWAEMRIGDGLQLRVADMCVRCAVVTVDSRTGKSSPDKQPLRTLASYRCKSPYGSAPVFGLYCALEVRGHVKVGDSVFVLRK